jgi:TolB protein
MRRLNILRLFILIIVISFFSLNSCEKKDINNCGGNVAPTVSVGPSPYFEPVCHPGGEIIGFNYYPLKEIIYHYGYDCPDRAEYKYDLEHHGFWLIDSNGQNQRQVLPYFLNAPSWSPDGKWIAFCNNGIISKMPFDGENFDTSSIVQLTTSGRNFLPSWSPSGIYIAYDNTDCGSIAFPKPPNSCGILIMDPNGNNKSFIAEYQRFPYWGRSDDTLFFQGSYYEFNNKHVTKFFDNTKLGFTINPIISFNPQKTKIFFKGKFTGVPGHSKLYSIEPSGENFRKISEDPIEDFSFLPDGRIVYVFYDYSRIDEKKGALWIMDQDGSNKHQLTFNDFIISF